MTITFKTVAYCAYVKNGKVEYCIEYADNEGYIFYTKTITQKEYNKQIENIGQVKKPLKELIIINTKLWVEF